MNLMGRSTPTIMGESENELLPILMGLNKHISRPELFEKDGNRCGYLTFDDEEIVKKMDDVTESMSALK